MDGFDSHSVGGSLQISIEVIEKIARHAALEVEGVADVEPAAGSRSVIGRITQPKAIRVELKNEVADIEVSIVVRQGQKIPDLSEKVQQSVKEAVQNMTSISVARVDVVVVGIAPDAQNAV